MDFQSFAYPFLITLGFSGLSAVFHYLFYRKRDISVALVLFSLLVFSIVFFVSFEDNIGLGIGLLGILSLIRLRSALNNLVDISSIFYAITIGLINASVLALGDLILINIVLTFVLLVLISGVLFRKRYANTRIVYDDLKFEQLNDVTALKKRIRRDLKLEPVFVKVTKIDYLRDSVTLKVTYEVYE